VNLLLDTHALLWWLEDHVTLRDEARVAIADGGNVVFVSSATAWEIAVKKSLGKLEAPDDLEAALAASRFDPLPISIAHALAAGALPRHHDDPFDRMLVAQAQSEGLTLVTRDARLTEYDVPILEA